MKHRLLGVIVWAGLGSMVIQAHAAVDDALLTAQKAYQSAVKQQGVSQQKVADLQSRLLQVQTRLKQNQADAERLQSELNQADAEYQQLDSTLKAAGEQLDAAWNAAKGSR